jgi:hypothetical protein
MFDTDPLDELLAASAPATTGRTPELREELTRMAVSSAHDRRASSSRRRIAVGTGIATVALLAGAATAAAGGILDWGPWALRPDVVYAYTLPSGEPCELRVVFDDDATAAAAREISNQVDLAPGAEIAEVIRAMREMTRTAADERGNTWDIGYGTEGYPDPDVEYDEAVQHTVSGVLLAELEARGMAPATLDATFASTCSIERAHER